MNNLVRVYIALGANLGDRLGALRAAVATLAEAEHISLKSASALYETAPVGGPEDQPSFLNGVLEIETSLSPYALLDLLQTIEQENHRTRDIRWGPRTLDLDILFFGDQRLNDGRLEVPHPRLHLRRFVLQPLADLALDFMHPVNKKTIAELLASLPDDDINDVVKFMDNWSPDLCL